MNYKYLIFIALLFFYTFSFSQKKGINFFLDSAVKNSPLLYDFQNQVLAARIDSQILRASIMPQINGSGNSYKPQVTNGWGYDQVLTNGGQLQAIATISKNLFPGKLLSTQFHSLQLTTDSIRVAARISEKDLRKSITTQYITTYGDQLQIDFNKELLKLLLSEEGLLKRLTQNNVYRQVDYLSFLVTYQQQNLTLQQLDVQYKNDYATLNYLSGIFDTTVSQLEEPSMNIYFPENIDSSAFFLKYKIDSLRLANARTLINLGYKPKINLFADAGILSSLPALQPYKHFGYSFGVNFQVPIFDGGQRKLQHIKIDIAERTRVRNKEFFARQYNQQIAQLRQQLAAIEGLLGLINKQINYIETLIEANGKLLATGDIRLTDYILAINNYITAKNLIVQNEVSRLQIINQINYWNK